MSSAMSILPLLTAPAGFEGVDEFDGVYFGGGPVHEFERDEVLPVEGAAVEPGGFEVQVVLEAFIGDNFAEFVIVSSSFKIAPEQYQLSKKRHQKQNAQNTFIHFMQICDDRAVRFDDMVIDRSLRNAQLRPKKLTSNCCLTVLR
jgi:hypothetical protein